MDLITVALIIAPLTLLFWLLRRPKHPIDALPGPLAIPLMGTTWAMLRGREAAFKRIYTNAKKYSPLYRIWHGPIPTVVAVHPKYIEYVLSSSVHINKSFDYGFLSEWLGTGLLISTGAKWHSRRKLLTPAFHFSILEQFVPIFCDKTRILVEKLRSASTVNPEGVDVVPYVTRCALDMICQTAMGTNLNAQDETSSPYVNAIYELADLVIHRMIRPWLWPKWIFSLTSTGRKFQHCVDILHTLTLKVIQERRKELTDSKDENFETSEHNDIDGGMKKRKIAFLDLLIRASEKDSSLTDEDIREEVDTFMFEGHDTTAMAMSWTLFYLGCNPDIQSRCVEECEEIFCGSDRDPNLTDLGNMKYLERVIKESLRLRPSVLLILRQLKEPLTMGEHTFPPGTKISMQIINLHHDPELYPDPEKFDPDRFLPENCVGRHPYAYIPFSAGPRNCIGQKFAMLEMKEVLSTVIRHFRLEAVDPEKHAEVLPDIVLRPKYGIKLKLFPRST